jgi:hypothetical protein
MATPGSTIPSTVSNDDTQVKWSSDDEKAMIQYLINNKAHAGDGCNFKDTVWNGVATVLEAQRTDGGVKTVKKCKEKWGRVSAKYHSC